MRRVLAASVAASIWLSAATLDARPSQPRHRQARMIRMTATAYCDRGPTKSGVLAQPGVVAADERRLPIGTRLRVLAPGQPFAGVYTVLDTGSAIKGRDLDIFMASCRTARRFGKRPVDVRILNTRKNRGNR